MGWFLSAGQAKKSVSRKKKTRKSTSPKPWDPQRTLWGLKVLGIAAVGLGLIIGWRYGERALLAYAAAHHGHNVTAEDVILGDAPEWMSEGVRASLQAAVAARVADDPMDGKSLRLTAEFFREDPWVRDIQQVSRLSNGQVRVQATYRQPVALVESADGYRLIDRERVCLPGLYLEHQIGAIGLPVLSGASTQAPNPGAPWVGRDLEAGLELALVIAREPYAGQVRRFDVSRRDRRDRLKLVMHTDRGMVVWGLPSGEEYGIEPTAKQKLQAIRQIAATPHYRGMIDADGQIVALNKSRPQVIPAERIDGIVHRAVDR